MDNGHLRTTRFTLKNSLPELRYVILEPWAGRYSLPAGQSVDIVAEGDESHHLEVDLYEDTVTVSSLGSEGAMLSIFRDGVEIPRAE